MGLLDKLKAAASAITGGAATVSLEYEPQVAAPGETLRVRVTATSTGQEVRSGGVFVDLRGMEEVRIPRSAVGAQIKGASGWSGDVHTSRATFEQSYGIAPALVLAPNATQQFEGTVQLPTAAQPTYRGPHAEHRWEVRGRLDAFGNDPDSGWLPLQIGARP